MTNRDTAEAFFHACESGKGWEVCSQYCTPDATFSAQADALTDIKTIEGYTGWTAGLFTVMPDAGYELKALGVDDGKNRAVAVGLFRGTHSAEGGPVPPTGKSVAADYVYVMDFEGDKIRHMTKVWNDGHSLRQLGWA